MLPNCFLIRSELLEICFPCYDMEEEGESELTVVLREALWAYIYMRHTPNPRIEEKTILPLTIIL